MHENVTPIKLPNLDQTALYFVMTLVSRDVAGIPCVWFDQSGGESRGRERKRTQRRLEYTIIMFLLSIWRTLKSESPAPSQNLDRATIAVITFGAYTSGRIDTILK